jgi:hypothetical protein
MDHCIKFPATGQGEVRAVCSCGWHSKVFGAGKGTRGMDPLRKAAGAADVHLGNAGRDSNWGEPGCLDTRRLVDS